MAKRARRSATAPESLPPQPLTAYQLRAEQVEQDLITGRNAKLLQEYFGEATYEDLRSLALDAQRTAVRGGPRVLILPGIMGSQLGQPRDVIWIDPLDIRRGRLVDLTLNPPVPGITSLGVIPLAYLMIKFRLRRAGFDADFHDYDWRQSLDRLGQQLADRIASERSQPVLLVAHSMGGVVSRAALGRGAVIQRLVMLGTPNYGSFVPLNRKNRN